jgi:CheY-like chemotaxis protein
MMKILILNPHIDASHEITRALQSKGHAVLLSIHPEEAMQVFQLHASSVDLVIVHREITETLTGLQFLDKLRAASPDTASIVTSEQWGEPDFSKHQATPQGANAYVRSPFTADLLVSVIDQMFAPEPQAAAKPPAAQAPTPAPAPQATPQPESAGFALESVSDIFTVKAGTPAASNGIFLESPVDELPPIGPKSSPENSAQANSLDSSLDIPSPQKSSDFSMAIEPTGGILDVNAAVPSGKNPVGIAEAPIFELSSPVESLAISESEPQELSEPSKSDLARPDSGKPDPEAAREMPYLFAKAWGQNSALAPSLAQALGDAVIPGGAANSPDTETLKKYLMLREQDVAVLSTQLRTLKDQLAERELALNEQRAANTELTHQIMERNLEIEEFEREKSLALAALEKEIAELKFQHKTKTDRTRALEKQVRDASGEIEKLKDRVRTDIRKIRVREKELENRLEIMKKDSEVLIGARETKIIELKRKLDLLEFNMDLLQDQYVREKETSGKMRQLLLKAAQVVRVAGGLLDTGPDTTTLEHPSEELAKSLEHESEKAS